jgi:Domain of unknown function (DUF1905)
MTETHTLTTALWIWTADKAPASWHFLTLDGEVAEAIHDLSLLRRLEGGRKRGWGSIKVRATVGETNWDTSIFPAKEMGGWLLPVKAAVRKAEGLVAGDLVRVVVEVGV